MELAPRSAHGCHRAGTVVLMLGSVVALAQKAPVSTASSTALASPAAWVAGSRLLQAQELAHNHILEQQAAVLPGGACPSSGLEEV